MKLKPFFILSASFFAGATLWKWRHPTSLVRQFSFQEINLNQTKRSTIVTVGDRKITGADLLWEQEYQALFAPELADKYLTGAYKKFALQNLIERDVLIQVVHKDADFNAQKEVRLNVCKKDAENRILEQPIFFKLRLAEKKLSRICVREV